MNTKLLSKCLLSACLTFALTSTATSCGGNNGGNNGSNSTPITDSSGNVLKMKKSLFGGQVVKHFKK